MSVEVMLHQALFGYSAGHNLLAASCLLSSEARRTLAVLTDASGPWPASGFDCVFTGTPLPDTPYYGLFCTWAAPEMPRPGCVWSHVLLIELADLAGLADLGELRSCFKRPTLKDAKHEFSAPLQFLPKHPIATPVSLQKESDCKRFVSALYSEPQTPFVTEAPGEDAYEDLIFAIWSQQWPRLRRSFRFSTGSFSDRGRGGSPFDLQITPSGSYRVWRHHANLRPGESVQENVTKTPADQEWAVAVIDDLLSPDQKKFRSFLLTYGADVSDPRAAFARLATAYKQLIEQPRGEWTDKLRLLATLFPEESEALRLKEWLVAPCDKLTSKEKLDHALATASFLSSSPEAQAYARVSFDHSGLAPFLWKEKREKVLALVAHLMRQPENSSAAAFVAAIAAAVQPTDLRFICDESPELISLFLSHHQSLAFEPETWLLPEHIQWRIYETLEGLQSDVLDWGKIMTAMFLTATTVAVRNVVEKTENQAMENAFHWLEHPISNELLPSQIWREALAMPAAKQLASDESMSPARLALCAWFVPARIVKETLIATRQDVQRLAQEPLENLPLPLRIPTAFLLVGLGLRTDALECIKLLKRGFFEVYDALASSQYSSESWSLISSELPRSPMWKEWDRCEKLRRAVRKRLSHVARKTLLEAAADSAHREIARKILGEESEEPDFID